MMKFSIKFDLQIYTTEQGKQPFIKWLESLKDKTLRSRVKERLDRLRLGNLGDHKSVGGGVMELRLKFGSGYRIYFGKEKERIILLLNGGDKTTQNKDILKAQEYWQDYLKR